MGKTSIRTQSGDYGHLVGNIATLLEAARRTSARAVNAVMTAAYWETGRRIVEFEQKGHARARYGEQLMKNLSRDLNARFERGFGVDNLQRFRLFYLAFPASGNYATASRISRNDRIAAAPAPLVQLSARFPLPWSAYVRLLAVKDEPARRFHETEALRGGWSAPQRRVQPAKSRRSRP